MAATATEKFRGASGDLTSHEITYIVKGATDEIDALQAVDTAAPAVYDGLSKDNFRYTELRYPDLWEVIVSYTKKTRQPPDTGSVEYAFEIGTTSQHIVQSLSTIATYGTGAITDFKGAINVNNDNEAEGVDVSVPTSTFSISYYPTVAVVTSTYQKLVRSLVGKVNGPTTEPYPGWPKFFGHDPGEVLFTGCSGRARNPVDWELVFSFAVKPNRTSVVIGDITGIAVDGWDLLWVKHEPAKDGTANRYIAKPAQVNVERVYERADFSVLGI